MYRIEEQRCHDEHAFADANILALGTTAGKVLILQDMLKMPNSYQTQNGCPS
jgi:hypothetical protein